MRDNAVSKAAAWQAKDRDPKCLFITTSCRAVRTMAARGAMTLNASALLALIVLVAHRGAQPAHAIVQRDASVGTLGLLEASGASAAASMPAWEAVAASATACTPGAGTYLAHPAQRAKGIDVGAAGASMGAPRVSNAVAVLAGPNASLAVMAGPTPHMVATGSFHWDGFDPSIDVHWSAAAAVDLDGNGVDEIALLRSAPAENQPDVVVLSLANDCATWSVVRTLAVPTSTTGTSSSTWLSLAAGDGLAPASPPVSTSTRTADTTHQQLILLRSASPQFLLVAAGSSASSLSVVNETDLLGKGEAGWTVVVAGDLSGSGANDDVVVADDDGTVVALSARAWRPSVTARGSVASADSMVSGAITCFFGDDKQVISLTAMRSATAASLPTGVTVASPSPVVHLLALNGSAVLSPEGTDLLDSGHTWVASAVVAWLADDGVRAGEHQLLALRDKTSVSPTFPVNMVVYGRHDHYLRRRYAVDGTLAQYAFDSTMNMSADVNVTQLLAGLTATNANTYSALVCDKNTTGPNQMSYDALITILQATTAFTVNGQALRVWVTLLPPTESVGDACVPPPDNPATPFNETALFDPSLGYNDYVAWAELMGRLGALWPQLVALQIDDMTHDVQPPAGIFTPDIVARMTSGLRANGAPFMSLIPTTYYTEGTDPPFVWDKWPDFPLVVDSVLFYFRNQKEGAGPCANPVCKWGPNARGRRSGGCLAGACADPTVQNAPGEIADIVAGLPAGRKNLQVGFYATGHSSLGTPTPRYVLQLMNTILAQSSVAGITFYRMHVPGPEGCDDIMASEGCIAADVFGRAGARQWST